MFKSSVTSLHEATPAQVQEFLNSFDTVLTDCDGNINFDFLTTFVNMNTSYLYRTTQPTLLCVGPIILMAFKFSGVLWIENNSIPGAADAMNFFRKIGKKVFYVTNNSTKVRSDFAIKAQQLGFSATQVCILSSS